MNDKKVLDTSDEITEEDLEFLMEEEALVDLDFTKRQGEGKIYESIEDEVSEELESTTLDDLDEEWVREQLEDSQGG